MTSNCPNTHVTFSLTKSMARTCPGSYPSDLFLVFGFPICSFNECFVFMQPRARFSLVINPFVHVAVHVCVPVLLTFAILFVRHALVPLTPRRFLTNSLASSPQYLQNVLRIKDPIHRQKIALKAMDVVLFGPSNDHRSRRYKDAVLVTSLLLAVGGCWYAFIQKKSSQLQIKKMIRDMESLSKAENQLQAMQDELSKARNEQEGLLTEKERLEERLKSELEKMNSESGGSQQLGSVSSLPDIQEYSRLADLESELRDARQQLSQANRNWTPPHQLQQWLQLTHELELRHYNSKKLAAECQLAAAKDGVCLVGCQRNSCPHSSPTRPTAMLTVAQGLDVSAHPGRH